MFDIYSPDALRSKIEKDSAGKRTIIYSAKGQPNYMYIVPRFYLNDVSDNLGNNIHPAFIVNNEIKDHFLYACYPASLHQGELLSLPNQKPVTRLDLITFQKKAQKTGKGFHLSTHAEWAALMLWCRHHNMRENGNTDYGRSYLNPSQYTTRVDGRLAGDTDFLTGDPTTMTAPQWHDWYHDNSEFGISDLCGNLWEWQSGMQLDAGEIQIIADNNAVFCGDENKKEHWQAINLSTGQLLPINSANSAKYDSPSDYCEGNAGTPILSTTIHHYNGYPLDNGYPEGLMEGEFNNIMTKNNTKVATLFKILGLYPAINQQDNDQVYLRNYGKRALMRGGAWYSQQNAGMRTLCLSHHSSHISTSVGGRLSWMNISS
ncbi:hypothetical protein [Proteus myxofaciens]|uniref:Sulfatase-modifying factor enzyme domain-containing protein n=1 Tax=Proteus myxofaciens ATCC 19692 TaxID=1354337 RepID=A0A198GPG4_9GAMM|nr:hypothetical protein [Proteus myxofaciens]OAT39317.1 hypothetical protein M983_0039 [Proteus myxofaciens ATCC 19692]